MDKNLRRIAPTNKNNAYNTSMCGQISLNSYRRGNKLPRYHRHSKCGQNDGRRHGVGRVREKRSGYLWEKSVSSTEARVELGQS